MEKFKEVELKLFERGYYVFNMVGIYNDEYEICNGNGNIVKDHLDLKGLNDFLNNL